MFCNKPLDRFSWRRRGRTSRRLVCRSMISPNQSWLCSYCSQRLVLHLIYLFTGHEQFQVLFKHSWLKLCSTLLSTLSIVSCCRALICWTDDILIQFTELSSHFQCTLYLLPFHLPRVIIYIESLWWAECSRWRSGGAQINDSREPEFLPAANRSQPKEGSSHA